MENWIGTSGFQYPEWKGNFYPIDLALKKMLPFYAERFGSTEINYSFRRVPSGKTLAAWDAATPPKFRFSFKAPQKITHFAKLRNCADNVGFFFDAVAILGPKLGAVLFQLPPSLSNDAALLDDFLATLPNGIRAAVEFRHSSWFNDHTFAALAAKNAALCVAESADLKTPAVATAGFGYLRLRREDYGAGDLDRWAKWSAAQRWSETFTYFKHEKAGVGPRFAAQFAELLKPGRPT